MYGSGVRAGKAISLGIARLGHARNRRATRVRQSQHAGHLVECFPGRIVDRTAQLAKLERTDAVINAAVAAADDQPDTGKDVSPAGDLAGVDVRVQVIHGHQRFV